MYIIDTFCLSPYAYAYYISHTIYPTTVIHNLIQNSKNRREKLLNIHDNVEQKEEKRQPSGGEPIKVKSSYRRTPAVRINRLNK